jgi:uncharacterized membrane protein
MTEHESNGQGTKGGGPLGGLLAELPTDRLRSELDAFAEAIVGRGVRLATEKLTEVAEGGGSGAGKAIAGATRAAFSGKSPASVLSAGVKNLTRHGGGGEGGAGEGGGSKHKVTNIVEQIDVGVPVRTAYAAWTQFADFPKFMKKVEHVEQEADEKLTFRAQILWSHRTWRATIIEQVPDERVIWRSEGDKGYVDGAVTFHELTPDLTRILVVLEYHPQGLFERTGNLWRAQGRRVRLELKHFRRHVMTDTILHPEETEGWRGEIRDGQVVRSHGEDGDEGEDSRGEADDYEEPEDEEPEDEEPEPGTTEAEDEADDYEGSGYEDGAEGDEEYDEEEPADSDEETGDYVDDDYEDADYEEEPEGARGSR